MKNVVLTDGERIVRTFAIVKMVQNATTLQVVVSVKLDSTEFDVTEIVLLDFMALGAHCDVSVEIQQNVIQ